MTKLPGEVDVLIVGAGPAGLFLATQLAKLKIRTRIIDKQAHPVLRGHADGLQCRTGEIFTALGVQSRFDEESHECAEVVLWGPDSEGKGLNLNDRVVDTVPGISWVRHVNLGQDRVEAIFMEYMRKWNDLEVERLTIPTLMEVDKDLLSGRDPTTYPVTVQLKKLPPPQDWANGDVKSGLYRSNLFAKEDTQANGHTSDSEEVETVKCKFVVGCDGARSWVRRELGLKLEGDSANEYWGAFDAIIKSDLTTLRMKNSFQSASAGSVLTVPRERGMVRVYTQMGSLEPGHRVAREDVTMAKVIEKTKAVLQPHSVEFPYVDWFTCYEIGQRLCNTFSSYEDHVFLAGDATHTHSPKAGQGMNVSMADSWNLGWKLAMALGGQADPKILHTYQLERYASAKLLIDFDYKWSRMISGKSEDGGKKVLTSEEWKQAWAQNIKFTSGTGIVYEPNMLISDTQATADRLASRILVGSHFENQQVVGAANAHTVQLQGRLKGDARWKIILFPGDMRESKNFEVLATLGAQLAGTNGPATLFTPADQDIDSVIETLTVFATPHKDIQARETDLPRILVPERQPYGIRAFDTLFCDEPSHHDGFGKAYEGYGIDPSAGCIVVVRPDQHVAGVWALDDFDPLAAFFSSFMLRPAEQKR